MSLRNVKSFVLRQGKITVGQSSALNTLLPQYGIPYQETPLDLPNAFANPNPIIIEIGCGMGDATWQIAKNNPHLNYIAIEVHSPGVGALLMAIRNNSIPNLRIIKHDAIEVLHNMIPNNSIAGMHIYFPDPWPKKRHHKRRLINPEFVGLLCSKLAYNGYIHCATDDTDYAMWMLETLSQNQQLLNQAHDGTFVPRQDTNRPLTKFEARGMKLGHNIYDLIFTLHARIYS